MKEILAWGNCLPEFYRLNINPKEAWHGYGWKKNDEMNVYELTEDEFEILCNDEDNEYTWQKACWRYSEGSVLGSPDNKRFSISNHWLYGWVKEDGYTNKYKHLLEYLCNEVGASMEKNVVSCAVDLARYNGLSLAELFNKYQTWK